MEEHYVTRAAVSSESLLLKKARPQGELLSLWFPQAPGENGEIKGLKSEAPEAPLIFSIWLFKMVLIMINEHF